MKTVRINGVKWVVLLRRFHKGSCWRAKWGTSVGLIITIEEKSLNNLTKRMHYYSQKERGITTPRKIVEK